MPEGNAGELVDNAIERYEKHFDLDFPLYSDKFFEMLANDEYDISLEGAKELEQYIDERIKKDEAEEVPENYYDIDY